MPFYPIAFKLRSLIFSYRLRVIIVITVDNIIVYCPVHFHIAREKRLRRFRLFLSETFQNKREKNNIPCWSKGTRRTEYQRLMAVSRPSIMLSTARPRCLAHWRNQVFRFLIAVDSVKNAVTITIFHSRM